MKTVGHTYHGQRDFNAVLRYADYLRFAFMVTLTNVSAQAANVRGFRNLIERSEGEPYG